MNSSWHWGSLDILFMTTGFPLAHVQVETIGACGEYLPPCFVKYVPGVNVSASVPAITLLDVLITTVKELPSFITTTQGLEDS